MFNPLTEQKCVTSFKTSTPRTITICLDLHGGELTFWLNDRRMVSKTVKLPRHEDYLNGPWVPCVVMEKERNKVALNPLSRVPSDCFHIRRLKQIKASDYYQPQFHNTILVMPFDTSLIGTTNISRQNIQIDSEEAAGSDQGTVLAKAIIHFKKVDDFVSLVKALHKLSPKPEIIYGDTLARAVDDETLIPEDLRGLF